MDKAYPADDEEDTFGSLNVVPGMDDQGDFQIPMYDTDVAGLKEQADQEMTAHYPRAQRHLSRANTEALLAQTDNDPDAKMSEWINEMRTARQAPNSRALCATNVWRYINAAICEGVIRPEVEQGGVRLAICR